MTPRGGGVEISFVFFIDIIMAVTGVMLFVIILLVLDLDQSKNKAKVHPAAAPVVKIEPTIPIKPAAPKPDDNAAGNEIATLRAQFSSGEAELQKMTSSITDVEKKIKSARAEAGELAKLSGRSLKRIDMSLADAKVADRKVVLIEFSRDSILVQPMEGGGRPVVCKGDTLAARQDSALDALNAYPMERFAIVLIVKPSAFSESQGFMDRLHDKQYAVGAEPLEEDRTAIKW